MNGQWQGRYSGTNLGLIVVNLDRVGDYVEGLAYLIDDNPQLPKSVVFIRVEERRKRATLNVDAIWVIDPDSGEPSPWANVKNRFPGVTFPDSVKVQLKWVGERLHIDWITNIGGTGAAVLPRSHAPKPSECVPLNIRDWKSFKNFVSKLESRQFLFRGQAESWRLRTAFHRTGRANLQRFVTEDIPTLYRHLSARTRHVFNLSVPDQNGAFFNLVQHHGYPTPLLDWTYSPFVAAFFAYREISNSEAARHGKSKSVRIFVFDQQSWRTDWMQIHRLAPPPQHLSIMEFIAIDNERMIPQQAASSVTNVDDIESYIRNIEADKGKTYLQVIDLPWKERAAVMRELSLMGITAGSLFPGLDGACEEIRERLFK